MKSDLLNIQPTELKFPFELKKQVSTSMRLVNTTSEYVAFKVKTTSPKKYCVRPNTGVVPPQSSAEVTIMMQAQKEVPPDMQCRDKFLVQSVEIPQGQDTKELSQELFNKDSGREIYEAKLRVIYVPPPQPPSPVAESPEEGLQSPAFSKEEKEYTPAAIERVAEVTKAAPISKAPTYSPSTTSQQVAKPTTRGWSFLHILIIAIVAFVFGYFYGQAPTPAAKT